MKTLERMIESLNRSLSNANIALDKVLEDNKALKTKVQDLEASLESKDLLIQSYRHRDKIEHLKSA